MKWLFCSLFRRARRPVRRPDRRRPGLEPLEDRTVPAGNLLVTVAGPYPQHLFREYTPTGTLVRSVNIPPTPGSSFDYARDLVEDPSGNVSVYNGTFTPYLATYNPATASWTQTTYSGWSTVSNVSYGGLALYHNFIYATDMATAGAMPNGIVRFDTVAGTATRLVSGTDFTDLNIGLDGNLYALSGSTVYAYDPVSGAPLRKVILPSADYRGIAVNAGGDIFTAAWNNVISHFNANGVLLSSITLNSSTGAPFMFGNPDDIDVAADGTIAIGSWSGHIVQMTSNFTNISYIDTGTNNTVFVTFAPQQGPPPGPSLSVNDVSVQNVPSGTTSALFTVSLSSPSSVPVTASYTATPGTAVANTDFYPVSGTVTFAPGQTSQTVPVPVIGDPSYDAPETFSFNLSNPNGATLGRSQGTGTILSAVPPPSLSVGNTTVVSGTSATTSALFTVSLSGPSPETTTVNYQTSNGSAWGLSDYTPTSGTLTFAPGQTAQTVAVPMLPDSRYDAPETFSLNLSSPVNATIAQGQGTGTILSGVTPPSLSVGDISVTSPTSGSTFATFTVNLSAPSNETTTVSYSTADGTAAAGSDYFSTSGSLMIVAGQTSGTVTVMVNGDSQPDPNETFTLNLSNPVNATIARAQGTCTIVSSVVPPPSLTVGDISVTNGTSGTTPAVFTVSLSAASSTPVTVNYATADGQATAGSDYTATSGTLTFAPGQTSQTVTVSVLGDLLYDFQETFTLNLSAPTGATLARSQATATIVSSLPPPTLGVGNGTVVNGTSGTTPAVFTISLSAGVSDPVTVNYATANGTATAGTDFQGGSGTVTFAPGQTSQTVSVPVIGDPLYDAPETFSFQLLGMSGATITQATGTILSGVPAPSLSVADVTVAPGTTANTSAVFTVSLSAASEETTTVNYATADGTALAGTDYQSASGTLTFAPGQTSQTVTVTILPQPNPTAGKTFTLTLSAPSNATLARAQATGTIATAPLTLSATTAGTATDYGGDGTFDQLQVTSSVLTARNVDATYSNTGSPLENRALLEYNVSSIVPSTVASVTFDFGEQFWSTISQYVQIYGFAGTGTLSLADATSPGVFLGAYDPKTGTGPKSLTLDRSAVLSLVGSSPYLGLRLVGVRNTETTVAGTSDPTNPPVLVFTPGPAPAQPTLTAANFIVNQGWQYNDYRQASFPLNLSQPAPVPVTVTYQIVDGTARAGDDYSVANSNGFVTIPAGQIQGLVTVNVLYDNTYESTNESLYLRVTGVSNATLANAQGQGTLVSTAPLPTVSVLDTYAPVTESPTGPRNALFYVILSNPSDQTITVNYSTADLTATAGSDYQPASGTVTFAPGQIAQAIGVSVLRDPLVEAPEQYALNLSGAVNATLGTNGVGTITSGEHAPVASAGPNQTVNEGATVQFDGSASSDADGDPLTFTWGFGDGGGATGPRPTHIFADNGTYTVTLSVSDGANVTTTSLTVTVLNVPPTAAVSGPADAVPGQSRTWTFAASDPSPVDQAAPFTYQINWGDGSTQTVQGSGSGVQAAHTFTAPGSFSVSATASDKDNGTGPAAGQAVTVVPAELQGGDLLVGGTTGDDTITLQPADASGTVDVVINGQDQGAFVPTGQVVVYGQSGNDLIQAVPLSSGGNVIPLGLPVVMFGGGGNDTLDARGVSGPTVLVGGGGSNTLYGGSGRNILIGGSGPGVLAGGGDDDLLIAGVTSFDANLAALVALRSEWARTDADYQTRINHLNGSLAEGLNGGFVLTAQSVASNGAGNNLTGGPGQDWFFAALGAANPDVITDLDTGELVTPL
jgi:hypothetical protein